MSLNFQLWAVDTTPKIFIHSWLGKGNSMGRLNKKRNTVSNTCEVRCQGASMYIAIYEILHLGCCGRSCLVACWHALPYWCWSPISQNIFERNLHANKYPRTHAESILLSTMSCAFHVPSGPPDFKRQARCIRKRTRTGTKQLPAWTQPPASDHPQEIQELRRTIMLRKLDEEEYGVAGSEMWWKDVKAGVTHFMCAKGLDSIIVKDVEERKPATQPANKIPQKKSSWYSLFSMPMKYLINP